MREACYLIATGFLVDCYLQEGGGELGGRLRLPADYVVERLAVRNAFQHPWRQIKRAVRDLASIVSMRSMVSTALCVMYGKKKLAAGRRARAGPGDYGEGGDE